MLGVIYAQCYYAECRYDECRGVVTGNYPWTTTLLALLVRRPVNRLLLCTMLRVSQIIFDVEGRNAECLHAECHYAECHYA